MKAPAGLASELIARQRELAAHVDHDDHFAWPPARVAAVDAAFPGNGKITRGAAVLFSFPELECLDRAVSELPTALPYIPGLLSFRELPAIRSALEQLRETPDVILCDGQGIAHPRRFGIACHLGVDTGFPTAGVGKSRLCGQFSEPGKEKGSTSILLDRAEEIGTVVRTRTGVKPLFVSVGHRISLATAVRLTLECAPRYRLPEPIRSADRLAGMTGGVQLSARCSR